MKKIVVGAVFAALLGIGLTGCAAGDYATDTSGDSVNEPISVEDYGLEETYYQLPDKRFVECFEYGLGGKRGSFTCELITATPKKFTAASESFDVVYVTDSKDAGFVCLDYALGGKSGAIACVPGEAR